LPRENASADPRRRAVVCLARVDRQGAFASRLLASAAALTREIVLGTLRWQLTLDHLLSRHLHSPLATLDPLPRAALRAGLYEAARLDTPPAVAVSEAVRVTGSVAPRAGGLVNAVLRRAAAEEWPDAGDETIPLALRFSHPTWLVERWLRTLGEERTRVALAANQQPAPLALLAAACTKELLDDPRCRFEPHPFVAGVVVCRAGSEVVVDALRGGRAYAIDPGAVLVARALPPEAGWVVDLTAAPGGKSLVLALERGGKQLLACDRHFGRIVLTRRNLRLAGERPVLLAADARRPPLSPGGVSSLLLDAPCSGTGTLRRHPEIRWRLRENDLAGLAREQSAMLAQALELPRRGGHLLYSTCSVEPEENAAIVEALGATVVPLADRLPDLAASLLLPGGGVVIPPSPWNDGFTLHLLRRP
jgi:16S rRNA (cytosine967-C5)-methyltransferase